MDINKAENLANTLIRTHLDASWHFRWNTRKSAFGLCHYGRRSIELSRVLTEFETEEAVEQTILHEIAHAISGPGTGHGAVWKANARKLGVKKPACRRHSTGEIPENFYKWAIMLEGKIVKQYHRKPSKNIISRIPNMYVSGRKETMGKLYLEFIGKSAA